MRTLMPMLTLTVLAACGGGAPLEGSWTYTEVFVDDDACGFYVSADPNQTEAANAATPVDIAYDEATGGVYFGLQAPQPDPCILDKKAVSCVVSESSVEEEAADATRITKVRFVGEFVSWDEFDGTMWLDVTCAGGDCATIAPTAPCSTTFKLAMVADE